MTLRNKPDPERIVVVGGGSSEHRLPIISYGAVPES
jgi:hypothetical protein